ncbi:unnamed protein product [Allacma fusca]|uniref:t-SNARE coiled-coil homology domain-containing protein n=1 Tax=Allacma fusca TaxID=39272 RepID=A0A8J2KLR3_9HEXA|nr:unnamed protein product [Allacma fusca]
MSSQGLMSGGQKSYGSTDDEPTVGFAGPSGSSSPGFFDAAQFYLLCDQITSSVFAIAKHANTLEKTLKTIGSKNDSKYVREAVHVDQTMANQKIVETTNNLKKLSTLIRQNPQGAGKEEQMRVTRLTSDFGSTVQRYTDLQKQIVAKMKVTFLPPSKTSGSADDDDQSQLVNNEETQAQAQHLQETLEFEQGMLIEREDRIRQIESDIVDVNDIMRELGTMVHAQGEAVDTIEGNIDGAYHEVEAGTQELQKAASYQTKYRKRLFCLLATGFIILLIVIILLATQLRS